MEIKSIFGIVAVAAVALSIVVRHTIHRIWHVEWKIFFIALPSRSLGRPYWRGGSVAFLLVFALETKRIERAPVTLFSWQPFPVVFDRCGWFLFFDGCLQTLKVKENWHFTPILFLLQGELIAAVASVGCGDDGDRSERMQNQLSIPRGAAVHPSSTLNAESDYYNFIGAN